MVGETDNRLLFIDVQGPNAPHKHKTTHQARSHAISVALARKRLKAEQMGENFRGPSGHTNMHSSQAKLSTRVIVPSGYLGTASVDPFETLSIQARRLTTLMYLNQSIRAGEPVVNINDATRYQSLHSVFEAGLTDGALTAALGLTMSYAANGGSMNKECFEFSSIACQHLRRNLLHPDKTPTPATFGAILLLLGVEVCFFSAYEAYRSRLSIHVFTAP